MLNHTQGAENTTAQLTRAKHDVEHLRSSEARVQGVAGGAGGRLTGGRYLQYPGLPHNDLLVSVLNGLGVETDTFGDPRFCNGPLSGLI